VRLRPKIENSADHVGERDKDAMNLGLLFFDEADQLVVLLDGFKRLDVDCLARRTGAVNHARDAPLQLGADGMTKRSPRMVMRSSCVAPSLESLRRRPKAFFNEALLALLIATDAAEFGEASSAREPSGWILRSMDSANGRRLVDNAADSEDKPGSLPTRRAGATGAATARKLRRWPGGQRLQFVGFKRRAGICALAASCVGSKRPPRGMETARQAAGGVHR